MILFNTKNLILSKVFKRFLLWVLLFVIAMPCFIYTEYRCGVITKDDKALNEGRTSKSAEKEFIEQYNNVEIQETKAIKKEIATVKKDYYEVLGLLKTARPEEIKNAYVVLLRRYYPTVSAGSKSAREKFDEASEAYYVLSDLNLKRFYDTYGLAFFEPDSTIPATLGMPNMNFESLDFLKVYKDLIRESLNEGSNASALLKNTNTTNTNSLENSIVVPAEKNVSKSNASLMAPATPKMPPKPVSVNETAASLKEPPARINVNEAQASLKQPPTRITESVKESAQLKQPPERSNIMASGTSPKQVISARVEPDSYIPPTEARNVYENYSEPTAVAREIRIAERNDVAPVAETQSGKSAMEKLKNLREIHPERKQFIYYNNESETGDDLGVSDKSKIIGTQLDHDRTQLYDRLYDKNKVIAAGGGGGLGEGGGAIEQKDFGDGGMGVVITDVYSFPAEINVAEVTSEETGNDLVNETFGKAEDAGEFYEEDSGNHAGKKIFEFERNGDLGLTEEVPVSIKDYRWVWWLGVFGIFSLGGLSFIFAPGIMNRKRDFF